MLRLLRHRTSVMDKSVADLAHPKILARRPLWLQYTVKIAKHGDNIYNKTTVIYKR